MEKDFVTYNQALRLKALGFDEPCLLLVTHYGESKDKRSSLWMFTGCLPEGDDDGKTTIDYEFPEYPSNKEEYWQEINIPTFSQAFRWFRDKYYLPSCLEPYIQTKKDWEEELLYLPKIYTFEGKITLELSVYEEAESACLDKLLEIVESNLK